MNDRALIVGRGRGVWREVTQALLMYPFEIIVCINGAGVDYPAPFHVWVSYHGYKFPEWIKARARRHPKLLEGIEYWTATSGRKVRPIEKALGLKTVPCTEGGGSGLIAVKVARQQKGARKLLLCGIPMLESFGHYDGDGPWKEANIHRKAWEKMLPELRPYVRSMSGWTQEQLGAPTMEWLRGNNE